MLLDIRNLTIRTKTNIGTVNVLDKVNLQIHEGEIHTLVGESGSGKSLIARAIMGFLSERWDVTADRVWFEGKDLLSLSAAERRDIIGVDIAMIFQDAKSYLDPNLTIGEQLSEAVLDRDLDGSWWQRSKQRKERVISLLHRVGIKNHKAMMQSYAHELSEGAAQKIMIASAIAHRPKLLIADEPTSTMEPATRQQIYRLLAQFHARYGMSMLMISQDLGAIMPQTERISMIYSGQLMETGPAEPLLQKPYHPYTEALLNTSLYRQAESQPRTKLPTLPGVEPTLQHLPIGCRLGPRCPYAKPECIKTPKTLKLRDRMYACHHPVNLED
ncbi:oligopeptide/dipeptide ABC transporter ATP-binding protein [Aliidiomarina haloalkalitolerans]|uniref:Peptide ABC transporter ATP-binding protein n=1 Tax=Aliidiomarina haloalkalitolerans TaxID=859059 RepID=A0A432VXZ7_9GAMM|nr:oligopeptide/dipeptide ABC transporter ATP-binding protein [Aliidiomarina haloalkalitolerans]MCL4409860.1 ATP-binding cassette domain-containing protein [Gammaproteobacteria bacterium]RUO21571.1 peptide ABC transporter ATP-binding protein [Aliidiomarina haloalkalitolerans]